MESQAHVSPALGGISNFLHNMKTREINRQTVKLRKLVAQELTKQPKLTLTRLQAALDAQVRKP